MHDRQQESAPQQQAQGGTGGASAGAGNAGALRQSLRSMSYDQGVSALSPGGAGAQAPVQLKIDKGTLEAKLSASPSYSGTIDADTDCATANAVGEEWVGASPVKQGYGPPFGYRLLSSPDGERQYRPPMLKQSGKMQGTAQANYEAKGGSKRGFGFNAHVTVTDIDKHVKSTPSDSGGKAEDAGEKKVE